MKLSLKEISALALVSGLLLPGVAAAQTADHAHAAQAAGHGQTEHPAETAGMPTSRLSPGTRGLLQEEMRGIAIGVQTLATALSIADWKTLQATAEQIRDSYILVRRLSTGQRKELFNVLPNGFRVLDRGFHRRADQLAAAAEARDADLAAFYFYQLMDGCVACHSQYAGERFPGFRIEDPEDHGH